MTTPTIVRIDTDGIITEHTTRDLLGLAGAEFDGLTEVVTLRSWWYDDRSDPTRYQPPLVGVIHDWSRTNHMPLNVKAWALYNRSPICGPMYVALDSDDAGGRGPLPHGLLAALHHPRFPVVPPAPPNLIDMMRTALVAATADGEQDVPDAGPLDKF